MDIFREPICRSGLKKSWTTVSALTKGVPKTDNKGNFTSGRRGEIALIVHPHFGFEATSEREATEAAEAADNLIIPSSFFTGSLFFVMENVFFPRFVRHFTPQLLTKEREREKG